MTHQRHSPRRLTRANQHVPGHDGHRFQVPSGRSKLLPLEIGIQAIKPSPYRTGPPTRRLRHLSPATGFLACFGPLRLSAPGQPSDPADLPSSLSHLQWGCVQAPRGALVRLCRHHVVPAALMQVAGVPAVGVQRVRADQHLPQVKLVEQGRAPRTVLPSRAHTLLPRGRAGVRDLGVELGQGPHLQRRLQRRGIDVLQDPPDRRLVRPTTHRAPPAPPGRRRGRTPRPRRTTAPRARTAHAAISNTASTPWRTPRGERGSGTVDKASTSDNTTAPARRSTVTSPGWTRT